MRRRLIRGALMLLGAGRALAGPLSFDVQTDLPPVIADSQAPSVCTITYLVADLVNDDLYAARMRIEPAESDAPVGHRLPCPADVPPRLGLRALDVCLTRTGEARACVFADMERGFDRRGEIRASAENASRCRSDMASDIGVACVQSGGLSVCNVACGASPQEATTRARARCEDKQQQACPITASAPVSGP